MTISPETYVHLRALETVVPVMLDTHPVRDSFLKTFNGRATAIRAATDLAEHPTIDSTLLKILRSHGFQIEYP